MAVPNNSTVRWFHSDMAGAPQIDFVYENILAIFDACLIDGFGTLSPDGNKISVAGGIATVEFSGGHDFEEYAVIEIEGATPAALNDVWRITGATATTFTFNAPGIADGIATGDITVKRATPGYWEKPFEDATRRAFRSTHPSATGCFLHLSAPPAHTNYSQVLVRGYESMTDLDTGLGAFPTFENQPYFGWTFQEDSVGTRSWAIFADEKSIYIFTKYYEYETAGGVLRFFGDFKPVVDEAYNCGITGAHGSNEYEPGRDSFEHQLPGNIMATARDELGANPGTTWLSRSSAFNDTFIFGTLAHPAINGGYMFHGPMTIGNGSMPRGTEPALWPCTSDQMGLMGQPNTRLGEGFKVLSRAQPIGRAIAIIRLARGDRDYESGCLGVDIEGPWA